MKNKISLMAVLGAVIESFLPLHAENKTGLQTPYVWMSTTPVENKIDYKYFWKDLNGNNVTLNVDNQECVNSRADIYTYNFYPSLSFSNENNSILRIEGTGLQKTTVIGVYGFNTEEDHVQDGFVMNLSNGMDEDETAITKAKVIHTTSSSRKSFVYKNKNLKGSKPSGTDPKSNKDTQKNLRIMSYTKSTNPRTTVASTFSNIKIGGKFVDGITTKAGVFEADSFPEKERANRNISVPELMVYDKALTDSARQRAETYLALKYGITLDVDYLLDDVVWEKDESYTRICGYGRFDKYNFSQSQVTTSERETPYYLKDTYFKNSFLNKSAYENLLVAGRMGSMEDSTLIIFGDNDAPFEINKKDTIFSKISDAVNFVLDEDSVAYFPLKRIWKLRNINDSYTQTEKEKLSLDDVEVSEAFAGSYDIKVPAETSTTIKDLPAFIQNGEISWVANTLNGNVIVSLGSNTYKFDDKGSIYVNGNVIDSKFKCDDMIEIVKKGNLFYVRKNGENIQSSRIENNEGDTDWSVNLESKSKTFEIGQFHYMSDDAFNDFVELSYDFDDSLSFYSNGNIYLIACNKEKFKDEDAEIKIYKMSSKDRSRSKVLFENLAWEPGDTYFTFAVSGDPEFGIADKKYLIEEVLPNCKNPNHSATGTLSLTFPDEETYAYVLIDGYNSVTSNSLIAKGSVEINNLDVGNYTLYVAPHNDNIEKFDIVGESESPEMVSLKFPFYDRSKMSASWIIGDAKLYSLSGISLKKPLSDIVCGVKVEDGKIYKVENGVVTNDAFSVKDGDSVKVAGAGYNKIKVFVNNAEVFEINQQMYDNFHWSIMTANGKTVRHLHFEEFRTNGYSPVSVYMEKENFVNSEHLSFRDVDLFTYPVVMYCPSDDDINDDDQDEEEKDNILTEGDFEKMFIYSTTNGTHSATVKCYLPAGSEWPKLIISDAFGHENTFGMSFVSESDGSMLFESDINVPNDGTYTAKVVYGADMMTGKFIIK